jgi:hypothetical protein
MDPIFCSTTGKGEFCWLMAGPKGKGNLKSPVGAYLFPIIENLDSGCQTCAQTKGCDAVNMQYLMFFKVSFHWSLCDPFSSVVRRLPLLRSLSSLFFLLSMT